ncbi:hypothetical protein H8959_015271 [Pygathrix nigripes]
MQIISHVFHVARGRWRLLTTVDVAFSSADLGFADAQLVLTHKDHLFGSVMAMDEPMQPIYCFIHEGPQEELQVSDGQHQATTLLEVQALEPYLFVANGCGLMVPQRGQGTINTAELHLDTNLNICRGDEVHYHVTECPR